MKSTNIIAGWFLAVADLLAASTAFDYYTGTLRTASAKEVTAQLSIINQLDDYYSALKDAEAGQSGYLLTGEENYLQPYRSGLPQVQAAPTV